MWAISGIKSNTYTIVFGVTKKYKYSWLFSRKEGKVKIATNIMIRDMDALSYMIIDPDDVQFDFQTSRCISGLVKPLYCSDEQ